jgi:predicted Ser/Thr protein kinase
MWDKLVENKKAIEGLPVIHEESPSTHWLRDAFQHVETSEWTCESDMYDPIGSVLSKFLSWKNSSHSVVLTHSFRVFRADLTTSIYKDHDRVLYGLYYFIELKYRKGKLDSSENCGQVVDYFHQVRKVQPYRNHFVAILSNFDKAWIFQATYERDGFRIVKHPANSLADAIEYAEARSSEQLLKRIPELDEFINSKSEGYNILATSRSSFLLALPIPIAGKTNAWSPPSQFKDIKRFALKIKHNEKAMDAIGKEVQILKVLRNAPGTSTHIPELVWSPRGRPELGIVPVGRPIDFRQCADTSRKIVEGLIAGLQYLHGLEIVHRDIRPSNLVLTERNEVIIIDYETALLIPDKKVEFFGGFICWPKRVLESDCERYLPCKSDDLHAAILLVLHLLFPSQFDSFYVSNIRPGKKNDRTVETNQLLTLWSNIEKSFIWGRFVLAANVEDYEELAKMSEVFCHM